MTEQKKGGASARRAARERERQAATLRVAGATWQQIADQLGFASPGAAHNAAERHALRAPPSPNQEEWRDLEVERLDALQRAHWPAAIGSPSTPTRAAIPPDPNAAAVVLRVIGARAKLLGLGREPMVDVEKELRRIAESEGLDVEELVAEGRAVIRDYEPRWNNRRLRSVG